MSRFPHPVETDLPMAALTTLGVGGPARYLARCDDTATLGAQLAAARDQGIATFVLGGGSNLLVADRGFDGLVLQATGDAVAFDDDGDRVRLEAAAGAPWDRVVARAVEAGLTGIECLSGIPGRVGAAPIQNIGAYGQELADTLTAVEVLDRGDGSVRRLDAAACGFGYRSSRFKGAWRDRFVVLGVVLHLRRSDRGTVRYRDLEQRFRGRREPTPAAVRAAVLDIRRRKSMVIDPRDPNRHSAGSFFVNPVVEAAAAAEVARRAAARGGGTPPAYPQPGGAVKLSAAWLIEAAGFRRGHRRGRAGLSSRHALALINLGGASAAELVALAAEIRAAVRDRLGVTLTPEPVFLGFEHDLDGLLG